MPDLSILADIGLGAMALALYQKISPLLDKTSKLVEFLEKELKDHEVRISKLENPGSPVYLKDPRD